MKGAYPMKRKIVSVSVVLFVALFIWATSLSTEYGEGLCGVCGEPATFAVVVPATDTKNSTPEFCETHGAEYREREGVPEWPGDGG